MKSEDRLILYIFAFLLLVISIGYCTKSHAHDDAAWIMADPQYRGKDGIHCCGPTDCSKISGRDVRRVSNGWIWKEKLFEDDTRGLYESKDNDWWGCVIVTEQGDSGPRCLFFPTGGA